MITTWLVAHPWVPVTCLALLVVLGPPVALWLSTRTSLARGSLGVVLLPVVVLTLSPSGLPAYPGCEIAFSLPTPGRVELLANVVLFIAPTLLGGIVLRRPVLALLVASTASLLIEVVQMTLTALGRPCSTNDWVSNTTGAAIGALLAWLVLVVADRRSSRAGDGSAQQVELPGMESNHRR